MAMAAATSATASHLLDEGVDLVVSSRTVLYHLAREVQHLSCQRVVRVNRHAVSFHLSYSGREAVLLGVSQGDDGSGEDVLSVKLAVDHEDIAHQFVDALGIVVAESLGGCQREVKLRALFQRQYVLFQRIE